MALMQFLWFDEVKFRVLLIYIKIFENFKELLIFWHNFINFSDFLHISKDFNWFYNDF